MLKPGETYAGRPPGIAVLNVSIPREAHEIIRREAATKKGMGALVARWAYEFAARQEARRDLMREKAGV